MRGEALCPSASLFSTRPTASNATLPNSRRHEHDTGLTTSRPPVTGGGGVTFRPYRTLSDRPLRRLTPAVIRREMAGAGPQFSISTLAMAAAHQAFISSDQ